MPGAINAPLSPVIESSLPAIWWLSQLQNPISEIFGPLLVPSVVAGQFSWHLVSEMKIRLGRVLGTILWGGGAEKSGMWQKKSSCSAVTEKTSVDPPGVPGAEIACQSCPKLGEGCQAFFV